MPSISGKTLGSNDDDHLVVLWSLPINTVMSLDIALPQFEAGRVDTAPEIRPEWIDELLAARYLQEIGAPGNLYAHGPATTANNAEVFYTFPTPMWKAPSLVTAGVAGDYAIADYVGAGGGACTSLPAIVSADEHAALLRFVSTAHGLTLGTTARLEGSASGQLLLSAEL